MCHSKASWDRRRVVFAIWTEISEAQAERNGDFETVQVFEIYEVRVLLVYDWGGNK